MPSENNLNAPLIFDFQALHYNQYLPSHAPVQPSDLQLTSPWIVSADFTDWLSKIPEDMNEQTTITNQLNLDQNNQPPMDESILPKLENQHNGDLYCRPSDIIPQTIEQDSNSTRIAVSFPQESLQDFKHVLYNLLVEYHNNPSTSTFVQPCTTKEDDIIRTGFRFNSRQNPEKKLPELYAQHIRKARLDCEDQSSVFIQDLYKYYLRACVELLSKYFEKRDKYTYLYDDIPLFVPGETLEQAEERIKTMKTRARKKRKIMTK